MTRKADWKSRMSCGQWKVNPDYGRVGVPPLAGNFASASYDSGETPAGESSRFLAGTARERMSGSWNDDTHSAAALPDELPAGPGSFAYAASQAAPPAPTVPIGWPPGLPFPGPPWPPGWDPQRDFGFYVIGFAVGGTTPTGWSVMDGTGTTHDLRASYLRGASTVNFGLQGAKTHTHTCANVNTGVVSAEGSHTVLCTNCSNASGVPFVTGDSIAHVVPNTTASDHAHIHVVTVTCDPVSHLPESFVIDWVGMIPTFDQLNSYPLGTILGFAGPAAQIPPGYTQVAALASKFAICRAAAGAEGADTNSHDINVASTSGVAAHGHADGGASGGSITHNAGAFTGGADPGTPPTIGNAGAHAQGAGAAQTSSADDHKPPYREIIYIERTSAPTESEQISSSLYAFKDPADALPAGWTDRSMTYDGQLFVGRLVGDAEFGTYGAMGNATHASGAKGVCQDGGGHGHTSSLAVTENVYAAGAGGGSTRTGPHAHTLTAVAAHAHGTVTMANTTASTIPASSGYNVISKD